MQLKQHARVRGAALITSLLVMVIVGGIAALIFSRTINEMQHSRDDAGIVQTLTLARGGANGAGSLLQGPVRDDVAALVSSKANTVSRWSFGTGSGDAPNATSVPKAFKDKSLVADLQTAVNARFCDQNFAPGGSASVSVRVYFTDSQVCGSDLPNGVKIPDGRFITGQGRTGSGGTSLQTYALPFVMVSEAKQGEYRRNVVLQGEYRFVVGRSSFARYAYFANQRTVSGQPVFFGDGEMIDGPIHSNEYLRYWGEPWFGGDVTVAGCVSPTAEECGTKKPGDYFNSSSNFVLSANIGTYCATDDCPKFEGSNGADFAADFVPLPANNDVQRSAANESGLLFNKPLSELELSTVTQSGKDYQIIKVKACANTPDASDPERCDGPLTERTFRFGEDLILEEDIGVTGAQVWQTYEKDGVYDGLEVCHSEHNAGDIVDTSSVPQICLIKPIKFNGVIFTDGGVNSLGGPARTNSTDPASAPPALADFSQITLAATDTVIVKKDLKYATPPCTGSAEQDADGNVTRAPCNNLSAQNVLGIYSQKGDVLFGTGDSSTPTNLTVHGVAMSGNGRVGTNNWDKVVNPKTELRILGGVIGETVAGFSWSQGGYKRNVTYDQRMLDGFAPPYFPTTGPDSVRSVFLLSFGQREQVY